jgi:hypothetical protein
MLAGLLQHPAAYRDDRSVVLGDRDEHVGGDHPARGVAPTQERLHAHDPFIVQVQHRLVDEEELICLERVRQVHLEVYAILRCRVHGGVELGVAVLAEGLRLV